MAESGHVWLNDLNPQQREAVTYGEGPLLIVAGAGSGKTRTLAYRVAYLISQGVPPGRILLLTFTRRAAEEMLKRAMAAIAGSSSTGNRIWSGTFHAIANRLLRIYAQSAGLSPEFTIIDRPDAEDFIDVVRNDLAFPRKDRRFPRKATCLAIYSRRANGDEPLETILKRDFPWCEMWRDELAALFREYVDRKQGQNVLDYDDLLLYLYYLLQDEALADSIGGRFDHVLVDEYQDTNRIQAAILAGMRRSNANITVVGDDAQSIYSFRSATALNMLDFPRQFPGTRVVTLEQNYRSTQPILETTNRVIAQARERYSKDLWSAREGGERPRLTTCQDEVRQDEAVIRQVLEHYEQGIPLREQAVLFRASSHSASLELDLTRRNIPFHKYGGLRFLEMAHVKDLISFLRLIENPRDQIAWFRVLQLLDGVGPATAGAAFGLVRENDYDPASLVTFRAPPAARDDIAALGELLKSLSAASGETPAEQIDRIARFYGPVMERRYENPEPRKSDIEHLGQLASGYVTRGQFLADLTLDPPTSTGDLAGPPTKDEDWLVLSTIHSAKGLEWDAVYLIHAADGCLPSDMATGSDAEIDEERRITYVAMTRARDFLYVFWPLRFYHKMAGASTDRHSYAQVCRFFTPDVVATMDEDESGLEPPAREGPSVIRAGQDIRAQIRKMWN